MMLIANTLSEVIFSLEAILSVVFLAVLAWVSGRGRRMSEPVAF